MAKLSPKSLKLVAVFISIVLSGMIYSYLSNLQSEKQEVVSKETQNSVVVAAVDIPKNTLIGKEMLKLEAMPDNLIQKESYKTMDEVVGTTAKEAIYAGEQVSKRRLWEDAKMAGFIGSIPDDKRAVSVPVNDITGVGGFAKPGHYVDIMLITEGGADKSLRGKILLQNMLLLAINKIENVEGKDSIKEGVSMATFAATAEEAVRLAVAQRQGSLHLALRPLHPKNKISLANEIVIYQERPDVPRAAVAPPRPPVPSVNVPRPAESPRLSVGDKVNVIRGNKVESVTTR